MKTYTPKVNQLIQKMQKHPAWFGNITGQEAETMLNSYPLNTFVLRTGENDLHYFLSYVTHDALVYHQSIRINTEVGAYYPNGGSGSEPVLFNPNRFHNEVDSLISEFLGCQEEDLQPVMKEFSEVQGF